MPLNFCNCSDITIPFSLCPLVVRIGIFFGTFFIQSLNIPLLVLFKIQPKLILPSVDQRIVRSKHVNKQKHKCLGLVVIFITSATTTMFEVWYTEFGNIAINYLTEYHFLPLKLTLKKCKSQQSLVLKVPINISSIKHQLQHQSQWIYQSKIVIVITKIG